METDRFSMPLKNEVSKFDVNLMTYINSKLVYVARHIKNQVDNLYDIISHDV